MEQDLIDENTVFREIFVTPSSRAEELASKYGYFKYMIERYLKLYGYQDTLRLLESMEKKLKPVVRINTRFVELDYAYSKLIDHGFELRDIDWYPYAFRILEKPEKPSIGATHEYLKGFYYVHRDAAPLIPVILLLYDYSGDVLDACAAPGGKTTFIAELLNNSGIVYANDLVLYRLRSLVSHILRMKLNNVVVTWLDATKIKDVFRRKFDRVIVDAPCSGEGVIMLDPSRKRKTKQRDLARLVVKQIKLLNSLLDVLNNDGILIYTTCSIAPEENEYVVSKILEFRNDVDIIEPFIKLIDWDHGIRKFHRLKFDDRVSRCIRITPFKHEMIGLTLCLITKTKR
ncbi:MAG: RsmB/NOP family class I SAM-dependent RNA methyltransferase [Desulfurococcaceae archaeon]